MNVKIKYCEFPTGEISPVSSKSISNRALIIQALTGNRSNLINLSQSEDTNTLVNLLNALNDSKSEVSLNTGHAGTVMRFLLSYCCLTNKTVTLTGSKRMNERPIANLINALRSMGASITCLEKEGFAPIIIKPSPISGGKIELDASISSQFISSLLLCAPYFENGIELKLTGKIVSASYIDLTIDVMKQFGVEVEKNENVLRVKPSKYIPTNFTVEGDWSSASYFYSLVALSNNGQVEMKGMNLNSLQGDKAIVEIGAMFGVGTKQGPNSIVLKKNNFVLPTKFTYDFLTCPDIVQTVAPMLAALGIEEVELKGVSTLTLKETDRIVALETELKKFGIQFLATKNGEIKFNATKFVKYTGLVNTYDDHRMPMGFAPLAQKTGELIIENEEVVKKSYIRYWHDLKSLGCMVENADI